MIDIDDVVRMAREAGFIVDPDLYGMGGNIFSPVHDTTDLDEIIVRFADLVAAMEREECAKVCESKLGGFNWASENADMYRAQDHRTRQCAAAIRARGGKQSEEI